MNKIFLMVIFFLIFAAIGVTQTNEELIIEGKELIDKGVINSDLTYLNEGRERFESVLTDDSENFLANYFLAYSNYRLAEYSLENNEKEQFENFINYSIMCILFSIIYIFLTIIHIPFMIIYILLTIIHTPLTVIHIPLTVIHTPFMETSCRCWSLRCQ